MFDTIRFPPKRARLAALSALLAAVFFDPVFDPVSMAVAAPSFADTPPRGSLVIIGGALRGDNRAVWERIVALAGGQGARIAVFPSASATPETNGPAIAARLLQYGADPFVVPVALKLAGTDYRQAADDPVLADAVRHAGGAFFGGGDQSRITQALLRADGGNSLVLDALWQMYRRGGLVAGSSAGAAIMSSTMFSHPRAVLATLRQGVSEGGAGSDLAPGLGFIGDDVFIDQHLLVRGRFARMIPAMLKKGYQLGLGVDENTALVVGPHREVEVIGARGALLLDLSGASTDGTQAGFNVSNARISYLDQGDRYDLATRSFTPAPDKKRDAGEPTRRGPLFYADVLGNTIVLDLMEKLIDSEQQDALGIAFGNPAEETPDAADASATGFEFRFSKTPDSAGYVSAATESYSVQNLRLDVRPIVVSRPLYQYR